jgi:hypothetical protein
MVTKISIQHLTQKYIKKQVTVCKIVYIYCKEVKASEVSQNWKRESKLVDYMAIKKFRKRVPVYKTLAGTGDEKTGNGVRNWAVSLVT